MFWINAKIFNIIVDEAKTNGNICRHAKVEKIAIIKQLSCKLFLKRVLDLLKNNINAYTQLSAFVAKIFWINAKIFNIIVDEAAIKVRKYITIFDSKKLNIINTVNDLKMFAFYKLDEIYINSFFNSENISVLFERSINSSVIEEDISTNMEINKRNISAYAIVSSETINNVEMVGYLEVRNNTQE